MQDNLKEVRAELPAMSAALLSQAAFAEAVLHEMSRKLGRKSALRALDRWQDNLSPPIERENVVLIRESNSRVEYMRNRAAAFNWVRSIAPVILRRLDE